MRIPVNSCKGCNQYRGITLLGLHRMGDGEYYPCDFVTAEMDDFLGYELLYVSKSKTAALRIANHCDAGVVWIGQSPINYWMVVKLK